MGLLNLLAKVGLGAAAPFTGGTSLAFMPAVDAISQIAGGAAKGAAGERGAQANAAALDNKNALDLYAQRQSAQNQAAGIDLDRKQFSEAARKNRMRDALIGELLGGGLQDSNVSVAGIPAASVTGGLRASAIGKTGKAAANASAEQALKALLSGDTFQGGQILDAPTLASTYQKPGKLESILSTIGLVGSGISGIGGGGSALPALMNPTPNQTQQGIQDYFRRNTPTASFRG